MNKINPSVTASPRHLPLHKGGFAYAQFGFFDSLKNQLISQLVFNVSRYSSKVRPEAVMALAVLTPT